MLVDMHAHYIPREFPPAGTRAAGERWPRMLPADGGARVFSTRPDGSGYTARPVWWDPPERRAAMVPMPMGLKTNPLSIEVICGDVRSPTSQATARSMRRPDRSRTAALASLKQSSSTPTIATTDGSSENWRMHAADPAGVK